ncbi:hypothetical protein MK805_07675 [Shimazuella sp. AN120528]|uniref:hypothetical protein n=1 Tax=Shimazuella soli TaxID=1892854 RepID=UPI001F0FAEA1|nr:hypothetical protein [Shimazuella soli]MCH5584852.1 hypothetical protein [Shimazuella soli]
MDLLWVIDNRTIPHEVTRALQELADKYHYTVDLMNQHKSQIINDLEHSGKGYIVRFLFPNGMRDTERWIHALIRMEVRRLHDLKKG